MRFCQHGSHRLGRAPTLLLSPLASSCPQLAAGLDPRDASLTSELSGHALHRTVAATSTGRAGAPTVVLSSPALGSVSNTAMAATALLAELAPPHATTTAWHGRNQAFTRLNDAERGIPGLRKVAGTAAKQAGSI